MLSSLAAGRGFSAACRMSASQLSHITVLLPLCLQLNGAFPTSQGSTIAGTLPTELPGQVRSVRGQASSFPGGRLTCQLPWLTGPG